MSQACKTEHMLEFRHDEDCEHNMVHESIEDHKYDEVQSEAWFKKLTMFKPGELVRDDYRLNSMQDLARENRLLRTKGDWDSVDMPEPRPIEKKALRVVHEGEMPSQDGQGVRNYSGKLKRAEFYGRQWHRGKAGRPKGSGGRGAVANEAKLAEALRMLEAM